MRVLQRNLFLLKDCVDSFNEIFGWSILFHQIYGILNTLLDIDDGIKKPDAHFSSTFNYKLQIYANSMIIIIFWVTSVRVILLCDQILEEFDDIVEHLLQIKLAFKRDWKKCWFLEEVEQSRPKFTVARFYTISRKTILNILNAALTFLIVIIQFHLE